MSKPKAPAFQFYASDFLGSRRVRTMTLEDRGAYITLLADAWDEDGLPSDLSEVAELLGLKAKSSQFKRIWKRVGLAFNLVDGRLRNPRQERERAKQRGWREKSAAGGAAKWGTDRDTTNRANRSERLSQARKIGRHTAEEWDEMRALFRGACVRCGASDSSLVRDHVVPIYKGGSDGIDNIQPLCTKCNCRKGPETTDWRVGAWERLGKTPAEIPTKWLANAFSPSPSPSPTPQTPRDASGAESGRGGLEERTAAPETMAAVLADLRPRLVRTGTDDLPLPERLP